MVNEVDGLNMEASISSPLGFTPFAFSYKLIMIIPMIQSMNTIFSSEVEERNFVNTGNLQREAIRIKKSEVDSPWQKLKNN